MLNSNEKTRKQFPHWLWEQMEYCNRIEHIMFAPYDGKCYSCGKQIPDNGKEIITGCKNCHNSFVE